jgi:hypothetical protein
MALQKVRGSVGGFTRLQMGTSSEEYIEKYA